ncbi:MAG: magnesium/cobalt transporter CorA [Candidatus Omnitrophica bacterium]|nr:magnesium/cobalt transporter CorA [Candidatus Omnitrophota bacterium]
MTRVFKKFSGKLGLPHGADRDDTETKKEIIITIFDYDSKQCREKALDKVEESFPFKGSPTVTWINIEGIDPKIVQKIDDNFGVHPLVSEDIVISGQRPKMEDYGDYIFIVLRMIYFSVKFNEIIDEQTSLILGPNFVISFQEKEGDVFDPIRQRIREGKGRLRIMGADYLAYALLDAVVDNYYAILEKRGEDIEKLEDEIMAYPRNGIGQEIHQLKRDMNYLRKQIWPLREVINGLQRNESKLIKKQTAIYLRDVYDHTIQIIDTIESFRDMLSGLHDIYLSSISNKMNEIMRILTVFAVIFIPLTFIAGVYGMNFEFMPELKWRYGYFMVLGFMACVGIGMVVFFKKKHWL